MQDTTYQVEFLKEDKYRLFKGLYTDFVAHAVSDYKFELEPLSFNEFIDASMYTPKNWVSISILSTLIYSTSIIHYS